MGQDVHICRSNLCIHLDFFDAQIIDDIAHGLDYSQIAAKRCIGYHAVKMRVQRMYRKLSIRSQAQLVAFSPFTRSKRARELP